MKKILILLVSIFTIVKAFAITLPDGREVSVSDYKMSEQGTLAQITLAMPVDFEVKIGKDVYTVTAKNKVTFYESGAVYTLFTNTAINAKIGTGNAPKLTDIVLRSNNIGLLELYENGGLKKALSPSSNVPDLYTSLGAIKPKNSSTVNFYENGRVDSFTPKDEIDIGGMVFSKYHNIGFHENGVLKYATLSKEFKISDGLSIKKDGKIEFSETFKIKSFVPTNGTMQNIFGANFLLAPDTPIEFDDDMTVKKMTVDAMLKNVKTPNILAEFSAVPDLKYVEIGFHKNREIKSLRVVQRIRVPTDKMVELNDKFFSFTSNGGEFRSVASKALFYDNGNIACEYHGGNINDIFFGRDSDNHMKFVSLGDNLSGFSFLDYYDINGNRRLSMVYLVKEKIPTSNTALVEFDRDKNIVDITEAYLDIDCDLLFNDDLIPIGYTKIIGTKKSLSVSDSSIYEFGTQEFSQEIIERLSN